jgi:hypothetical protein
MILMNAQRNLGAPTRAPPEFVYVTAFREQYVSLNQSQILNLSFTCGNRLEVVHLKVPVLNICDSNIRNIN